MLGPHWWYSSQYQPYASLLAKLGQPLLSVHCPVSSPAGSPTKKKQLRLHIWHLRFSWNGLSKLLPWKWNQLFPLSHWYVVTKLHDICSSHDGEYRALISGATYVVSSYGLRYNDITLVADNRVGSVYRGL